MHLRLILLCLPVLVSAPGGAGADATLVLKGGGEAPMVTLQVRDGMARMQALGSRDYVVFDAARNLLFLVEPGRSRYIEVDEASLVRTARALAAHREVMKQQILRLPQEQRARALAEMGLDDVELEIRPGATREVGGVRCRDHEVRRGGEVLGGACMASARDLGLSPRDFRALSGMRAMLRRMSALEGPQAMDPVLLVEGGVPVSGHDAVRGESFELQSLSTRPINPALFTEYTRYRRQRMADALPPDPC